MISNECYIKKQEDKILDKNLKNWYLCHKIVPQEKLVNGRKVYLITDHNGVDDSNYRIFLNPANNTFGLEFLDNIGNSIVIEENIKSLNEALNNM